SLPPAGTHFRLFSNPFPNLWSTVLSRVAFLLTKWKQKALQHRNDTERSFVDDCRTVHELPAGASRPINWNLLFSKTSAL
ncbi:MAG: hypothetical protein IJO45_02435, partial [Oscillospiraceae bacterium]|nr:hypothetical protein [Oscillospiraceae bacterium]